MSLIIATGSNLKNKKKNLLQAKNQLCKYFDFVAESQIFSSPAIEYLNQPDFYNQVLEFKIPSLSPQETLKVTAQIEYELGRKRDIPKGPRIIDIDIIFWDLDKINQPNLVIPHPAWSERSFVVEPLQQLPFFSKIQNHFIIPKEFKNSATPI
jgi:2-amino-4-hydroxy-6-hydroxymethyldihydropteridine diphosphokinase